MEPSLTPQGLSIYHPIATWQTRLIRLHTNRDVSDSSIVCDLINADILHEKFGPGLGVQSVDPHNLTPFHALSYAWGDDPKAKSILCNGVNFRISLNLHMALQAICNLLPRKTFSYIWIDAICIDQKNDREKAIQVDNMLVIYQRATMVVAWLGPSASRLLSVLRAEAACQDHSRKEELDFESVFNGIRYVYMRPYFQRIWIQQEVFAAQDLRFLCGYEFFKWPRLLEDPKMLCQLPQFIRYTNIVVEGDQSQGTATVKKPVDEIASLNQLRLKNLKCFEQSKTGVQPDFIEALLETSLLRATNPRDQIYGILGMTGFSAKPMSLATWAKERPKRDEVFLPIDYTASLHSILCAVTRTILMKGGMSVLAHLKTFASVEDPRSEHLPSWVVDWRLSAKLLRKRDIHPSLHGGFRNLDKAWYAWIRHAPGNDNLSSRGIWTPISAPASHYTFCVDNMKSDILPTELVLRGFVDRRCHMKGHSVWVRLDKLNGFFKGSLTEDKVFWRLKVDVHATDIVVYSPAAGTKGRWLLRPYGKQRFVLIAYLSNKYWAQDMYSRWEFRTEGLSDSESKNYRPLFVGLSSGRDDPPRPKGKPETMNKFIIV